MRVFRPYTVEHGRRQFFALFALNMWALVAFIVGVPWLLSLAWRWWPGPVGPTGGPWPA